MVFYKNKIFSMVAKFLGTEKEEAEIWIVNLIRSLNIQAKIDNEKVKIIKNNGNFNEQVIIFLNKYLLDQYEIKRCYLKDKFTGK